MTRTKLQPTIALLSLLLMAPLVAQERAPNRLPENDAHLNMVRGYVEATPVAGYTWASEAAYEAFRDMKYGVRIHWGIYSIHELPDASWPFLKLSNDKKQEYQELYKTWNPTAFDADEWMELFRRNGLRMFAFTTKHHDGFSMFDTKTRVRQRVNWTAPGGPRIEDCDLAYSIMETPFGRDVVAELCASARRHGIKIDLYFSHPDWYDADFRPYAEHPLKEPPRTAEQTARMVARHRAQLRELLTNCGRIDMLCLDQWFGPDVWPELRETVLELRKLQPDVMLRARGIGNYGDYYTPEGFVPGAKENTNMPWFVIYPLCGSFSYVPEPERYRGGDWVVRNLVDAVAKGGGFMVGIGPDGLGRFHPRAIEALEYAGEWLRVNGEAIYGTRPRDGTLWQEGEAVRYTRSKDGRVVYAIAFGWSGDALRLKTVRPREGSRVKMLGVTEPLDWSTDPAEGLVVKLPDALRAEVNRPCKQAYAFRIEVG